MTRIWVAKATVLAIHGELLVEHGGRSGLRDENGLESALARPLHLEAYDKPDIHALAACYACGLAQRQHFFDGNKRVSAVVTELFLNLNGVDLVTDDVEIVATWMALASNRMTEQELSVWLRKRTAPI